MFHRVKSIEQEQEVKGVAQQPADKSEEQQETSAEITELKTQEQEVEAPESTETTEDTTTETQEEDTETMTEQDNSAEQEAATESEAPVSTYQRAGTAPVRAPSGGYPGSYGYSAGPAAEGVSSDRRLTIGAGITMSGEIESCDYLLVEGTVEAALKGANVLEIAESGTFYGTVEIGEANIAGRFEGDITVHGRLTITATGTVTGSISYKELEIEAGAVIDGKLTPLSAAPAAAKKSAAKAEKPKEAPKAAKVEKQPEPANTDGGLFSKTAAAAE